MKPFAYAKQQAINYQTAWRMWRCGELSAHQLPSGTVIVNDAEEEADEEQADLMQDFVAMITRFVSSSLVACGPVARRLKYWQGWS